MNEPTVEEKVQRYVAGEVCAGCHERSFSVRGQHCSAPGCQFSWAVRIPAAIEQAWKLADHPNADVTEGEVALASALHQLWEVWQVKRFGRIYGSRQHACVIAFTEKVESL